MKFFILIIMSALFVISCSDADKAYSDLDSVPDNDKILEPDDDIISDIEDNDITTLDNDIYLIDSDILDEDIIFEEDNDNVFNDEDLLADDEPDLDRDEILPECGVNETKIESCGFNGNGEIEYVCKDGRWIKNGTCSNEDECMNNDGKSVTCGFNGKSTILYTCINGKWEITSPCNDPDECVNDNSKIEEKVCGYNGNGSTSYICIDGKWSIKDECIDPDECATSTWKGESGEAYECLLGKWVYRHKTYFVNPYHHNDFDFDFDSSGNLLYIDDINSKFVLTKLNDTFLEEWSTTSDSYTLPSSMTIDQSDNTYITGSRWSDIFLTKVNVSENVVWTKTYGSKTNDNATSIILHDSHLYLVGDTKIADDGQTITNNYSLMLQKFDLDGEKVWYKQIGASLDVFTSSISIDSNANIYVTGYTKGYFDGYSLKGYTDAFLVKIKDNGNSADIDWVKQFGSGDMDAGTSVVTDSIGNVYVGGYVSGRYDNLTPRGDRVFFITKFSSNGTKQWSQVFGSEEGWNQNLTLTLDDDENLYAAGYFRGKMADISLFKFDKDGNKLLTRKWGSNKSDYPVIMKYHDNMLYIEGYTFGDLDGNTNEEDSNIFFTVIPVKNLN